MSIFNFSIVCSCLDSYLFYLFNLSIFLLYAYVINITWLFFFIYSEFFSPEGNFLSLNVISDMFVLISEMFKAFFCFVFLI